MLQNDCTVLYEPTVLVRKSGRVPKTLEFKDREGDGSTYYIEPEIYGDDMTTATIFYSLPTKFARVLLADERFFLIHPKRMVVRMQNNRKFDYDNKLVKCVKDPRPALKGKEMDEESLEDARVDRLEKENSEIEASKDGSIPEHMKFEVKKREEFAKSEEIRIQKENEEKAKRQQEDESKRSPAYKVGADETQNQGRPQATTL